MKYGVVLFVDLVDIALVEFLEIQQLWLYYTMK
jgi:hypothetical protein